MATIGRLVLRVLVGALFVGHGTKKLFGWFGGQGPEGTGAMFESAGLRPGKRNALAAGATEAAGGVLLATGLATPVAASLLSGVMLTATRTVHWERGVWNSKGGYEYPAVILAVVFALAESARVGRRSTPRSARSAAASRGRSPRSAPPQWRHMQSSSSAGEGSVQPRLGTRTPRRTRTGCAPPPDQAVRPNAPMSASTSATSSSASRNFDSVHPPMRAISTSSTTSSQIISTSFPCPRRSSRVGHSANAGGPG